MWKVRRHLAGGGFHNAGTSRWYILVPATPPAPPAPPSPHSSHSPLFLPRSRQPLLISLPLRSYYCIFQRAPVFFSRSTSVLIRPPALLLSLPPSPSLPLPSPIPEISAAASWTRPLCYNDLPRSNTVFPRRCTRTRASGKVNSDGHKRESGAHATHTHTHMHTHALFTQVPALLIVPPAAKLRDTRANVLPPVAT